MTKKSFFILMLVSATLFAKAQETPPEALRLTINNCLELAYAGNFNRQSTALNEDAQKEQYKLSKSARLPSVSASLGESYVYNRTNDGKFQGSYTLNAEMPLYQGGNLSRTIEKNQLLTEKTAFQTAQYDNDLTINVLQTFLTALGNEELLRSQQSLLATSEEQVRQGKARFEGGEILESDYLLLESQYASNQNNVTETEVNLQNNLNKLKALMSIDPLQAIEIIAPQDEAFETMELLPSEKDVLSRSLQTLPDLKISNYNVLIAKKDLEIAKTGYLPKLSLNASVGSGHYNDYSSFGTQLDDNLNGQVGLSLSIPIFSRNQNKTAVAQSKISLKQAELTDKQTQIDVKQNIIEEYRSVVVSKSSYKASELSRDAYLSSFNAYQAKFEQGAITTVELLQQQNNYINALYDYIQNKYGFMLKRKVLDVYMGENIMM